MSSAAHPREPSALLVGNRYRLEDRLGAGGCGEVHRAVDGVTGEEVAVKLLSPLTTVAVARQRREVMALRALQAPGVVRLVDEGEFDGRRFIVMEYVRGEPFPGSGVKGWDDLAPRAIALLEALARVHALGVIHRDLKPANILVDQAGRVVLLDFGLAKGEALGDAVTRPDAVVGTPRYQAPEQLTGHALDARTDLYAVGLILYEALTGRPPHPLDSMSALVAARVWRDAPPLQFGAPDAPLEVCALVDRLLARLPDARPRTAHEALAALRGRGATGRIVLPRLGGDALIRSAVDLLHAQAAVDLVGAAGMGRTRFLADLASALGRAGRRSARIVSGARPFESVAPVVGPAETSDGGGEGAVLGPEEVGERLGRRLRETLAGGTVLLVDDAEEVDPWSAPLLSVVADAGGVVRAWRTMVPGALVLQPLGVEDLQTLFHGPDRLLHLPTDAARVLHERTAGVPGRVMAELVAWVGAGLASWEDGRVRIDRTALDRLLGGLVVRVTAPVPPVGGGALMRGLERVLAWATLAWPHSTLPLLRELTGLGAWEMDLMVRELLRLGALHRTPDGRLEPRLAAPSLQEWTDEERRAAHGALAARLPPGSEGRFAHLVSARALDDAAREARVLAARLEADGYVGRAVGVLCQGLEAARQSDGPDAAALELDLLVAATEAAMAGNLAGPMRHVRYELSRATADAERVRCLDHLLRGGLALAGGDAAGVAEVVAALPAFAEPGLEVWRRALALDRASRLGRSSAASELDDAMAWADATGSSALRGRILGWHGLVLYREGRYAEAAAEHMRALPLKEGSADRLSTLLNAASAFLEAQEFESALRCAEEAESIATGRRLALFEARAVWIRRGVAYRRAAPLSPDLALVDAVGALGAPRFAAMVLLQEATIAWRAGDCADAARIAARAAEVFAREGAREARVVCDALTMLAAGELDAGRWRSVAGEGLAFRGGDAQTQVLGLVAAAGVVWDPAWGEAVHRSIGASPARDPNIRQLVLAQAEVVAYVAKASAGSE